MYWNFAKNKTLNKLYINIKGILEGQSRHIYIKFMFRESIQNKLYSFCFNFITHMDFLQLMFLHTTEQYSWEGMPETLWHFSNYESKGGICFYHFKIKCQYPSQVSVLLQDCSACGFILARCYTRLSQPWLLVLDLVTGQWPIQLKPPGLS